MLGLAAVKAVERLLAEGKLSHRKIARAARVSRASVDAIAAGKRPDYDALRIARGAGDERPGPLARCPTCGGLVTTPCRACRVRAIFQGRR